DGQENLKLTSVLLDFVELPCSHTVAENMANAIEATLKDYGIREKIIFVMCNNVSTNTAMLEDLAIILPQFVGKQAHVYCFVHTINLTAKGVLCPFEYTKAKEVADDASEGDDERDLQREELITEMEEIEEQEVRGKDND
ncbi:hypothetical protein EV360DRAFT_1034, partial [Lentinula raphanica]